MLIDMIKQHIDYNYWAHGLIWECVLNLTDEQFIQPLDYSVGAIRTQLVHTMWAEDVWLNRIRGGEQPTYVAEDFPTRADIRIKWDIVETNMRAYIHSVEEAELGRVMHYQNSQGTQLQNTVIQTLLHMINHGTDHRAQTLAMMHGMGAKTIAQDYSKYLRQL